ncbi:MAG: hypothetical protein ABEH65_03530 [Halobacteriales archaeon]
MEILDSGVRLYLLVLTGVATGTVVWGINRFLLGNTSGGTGWPVMIGVSVVIVALGLLGRLWYTASDADPKIEEYPW